MRALLKDLDPRRSLAAAIGWSLASISLAGAVAASLWLGAITRERTETQIGALFSQYATQVSNELDINLNAKLQWVRATASMFGRVALADGRAQPRSPHEARRLLDEFRAALPELEWVGFADPAGRVVVASDGRLEGSSVADRGWFRQGRQLPWAEGVSGSTAPPGGGAAGGTKPVADPGGGLGGRRGAAPDAPDAQAGFVHLSAPVVDARGELRGVIGARLSWSWAQQLGSALTETLRARRAVQTLLIDADGLVLLGPPPLPGKRLDVHPSAVTLAAARGERATRDPAALSGQTVSTWSDGRSYLAGYAVSDGFGVLPALGWTVWVREPADSAFAYARLQQRRVFGVIAGLGLLIAAAGIVVARRLTRELARIARSADEIRGGRRRALDVPAGDDEAARIGRSMQALLDELAQRTAAVERINAGLDARVAARTREVERMAEENRHAAVVRERLRLARDLHDTLAHTMMAVLTEIRLMRKLADSAPARLRDELERAEAIAQEGLRDARAAIGQLRRDVVRDVGLGEALRALARRFEARAGVPVDYRGAPAAEALADSRAQVLYRIAEEALRNAERHAGADRVTVALEHEAGEAAGEAAGSGERDPHAGAAGQGRAATIRLSVADDGIGFDPSRPPPEEHYGLRGMAEQAELIGARLVVTSVPDQGTRVEVVLPV